MRPSKKEISLIFILIIIAIVRYLFFLPVPPPYEGVIGQNVVFEGIVSEPPDVRVSNKRIVITKEEGDVNILAIIPLTVPVSYGDIARVTGELETPENFMTDAGKEFNYERYLANQDIYFIIKNAEIEVLSHGHGNYVKSLLFKLRDVFIRNINKVIGKGQSDLANGLILGVRGGFSNELRDKFISTGTIHIVALSGYNVTIVAEGVMKVFGLILAQTASIILGIVTIVLFVILAGASATAVRAGIMAGIVLFARMTGRTYDAGRALFIAALIMVAYDLRIVTDISFQLSFIATFGVLFVTPKTIKWVKFLPNIFGFRELVATTLAATITVLPILLYSTGVLSIVSIPANILILPIIPITMFMSFIVGVVGLVSTTLSIPFAYISHLLLSYILSIVDLFASIPFASVIIKKFPIVLVIVLYIIIVWWSMKKSKRIEK